MLLGTFVFFSVIGLINVCKGELHKGTLKLHDNLRFAWRINATKGTIVFKVNATVDKNKGWFLIGLAPQNKSTKVSLGDLTGYGCILWKGHVKSGKTSWQNTEVSITKGKLEKSKHRHYHLGSASYNNKQLSVLLWRNLKDDKDIIEIKHGIPVTVFGSFGNDGKSKWKNLIKQFSEHNSLQDAFSATGNVDFFKTDPLKDKNKTKDKNALEYAAAVAEKHWIGVVIGISAFLTVVITCSVYCITKKKKAEFKRVVSMPFHKNTDYDDEAKVAFLQSEET